MRCWYDSLFSSKRHPGCNAGEILTGSMAIRRSVPAPSGTGKGIHDAGIFRERRRMGSYRTNQEHSIADEGILPFVYAAEGKSANRRVAGSAGSFVGCGAVCELTLN